MVLNGAMMLMTGSGWLVVMDIRTWAPILFRPEDLRAAMFGASRCQKHLSSWRQLQ